MRVELAEQFKQVFESRGIEDLEPPLDRDLVDFLDEDDEAPVDNGDLFDDVDDVCRDD